MCEHRFVSLRFIFFDPYAAFRKKEAIADFLKYKMFWDKPVSRVLLKTVIYLHL